MNREDIIRMAEECGIPEFENNESQAENIMRFAALVASAEREACAYRAGIALLGADRGLSNRVDQAFRARGNVATNDTSQERVDETTKQRHDTPPQRPWTGLTDEEILKIYSKPCGSDYIDYARAIEAKLKEKNT